MTKFTRRNAIALSAAAPALGLAFPLGGEIDQSMVGINIKIAWMVPDNLDVAEPPLPHQWCVWTVDIDALKSKYWKPGMAVLGRWRPLTEYLSILEDEFGLKPRV